MKKKRNLGAEAAISIKYHWLSMESHQLIHKVLLPWMDKTSIPGLRFSALISSESEIISDERR